MRLLVDTNIFLEVLLGQERAEAAQRFLSKTDEHEFFMSDFFSSTLLDLCYFVIVSKMFFGVSWLICFSTLELVWLPCRLERCKLWFR